MTTEMTTPVAGATVAPGAVRTAGGFPRPHIDVRYLAPILVTLILVWGNLTTAMLESPWKTGLAIVSAILTEIILSRILIKKWPHFASSYISGISVGMLLRSPFIWPFAWTGIIATMSKYVIRYKNRHLFNPSNFAIVAMLLLAPSAIATLSIQWGNNFFLMIPIWAVGLTVLYRLRRLHITLTYVASFIFFAAVRTPITGSPFLAEVSPITGPMYQLYCMFMITDPPTTVSTRKGQMFVVFCVAAMECVLRLAHIVHAPYFALFIVGPTALAIELTIKARRATAAAATAAVTPAASAS